MLNFGNDHPVVIIHIAPNAIKQTLNFNMENIVRALRRVLATYTKNIVITDKWK